MADLNMVMLEGRVSGEAETRKTAKGLSVTTFKIEHQAGYLDKDGHFRVNSPQIIEITLFGGRGEGAISQFSHGDEILIEGKVSSNEWKDKYYTKIIASTIMPRGTVSRKKEVVKPVKEVDTPEPDVPKTGTPPDDDTDLPF